MFEGSGHGPHIDAAERWGALFFAFLASVEAQAGRLGERSQSAMW
jgi:hypothetical protein